MHHERPRGNIRRATETCDTSTLTANAKFAPVRKPASAYALNSLPRSVKKYIHRRKGVQIRSVQMQGYTDLFYVVCAAPNDIAPFWGIAFYGSEYCIVRQGLPLLARDFVEQHELYHLTDSHYQTESVLIRELKATLNALFRQPVGFAFCMLLSATNISRIRLYRQNDP
jgi:hypothetical protein